MHLKDLALGLIGLALTGVFCDQAHAVRLVVMATNTLAVPNAKVFTIGVKVTAADVAAAGSDPVLFVHNITFTGTAGVQPIHSSGAGNRADIQTVQTTFIDTSAGNNGGPPSANLGSTNANNAFYRDSWWYNSTSGLLNGVIDAAGNYGTVTTNPASDFSGVYTLGAPNAGTTTVGSTGYLFSPSGSPGVVPANATTGQTMSYSGQFGPAGANFWNPGDDSHVLGNQLVANGGSWTVPLVQLVVTGDIAVPSQYNGGAGTYISFGDQHYNILGGRPDVDPGEILFYTWIPPLDLITGDANFDRIVNGQDLAMVASNWLRTGEIPGDVNDDEIVNGQDIGLIAAHWLNTGISINGAVPEPSTLVLATLGILALLTASRSKSR